MALSITYYIFLLLSYPPSVLLGRSSHSLPHSLTPSPTHSSNDKFFFPKFSLFAGDVDLCLVPEVAIELEGERGCLPFLKQRVAEQGTTHIVWCNHPRTSRVTISFFRQMYYLNPIRMSNCSLFFRGRCTSQGFNSFQLFHHQFNLIFGKWVCPPFLYPCIYLSDFHISNFAGHAVIVVAEGAGEELLGQSIEMDASGNRKLPAIGVSRKLIGHSHILHV